MPYDPHRLGQEGREAAYWQVRATAAPSPVALAANGIGPTPMDSAMRPVQTQQSFSDFMWYAWMSLMLLFVGIFQFLRWEDSR